MNNNQENEIRKAAAAILADSSAKHGGSTGDEWRSRLLTTRGGGTRGNVANAITALRYAPEWQGVLHFNESSLAVVGKEAPPFELTPSVPFEWTDEHDILAAAWLQCKGIPVNKDIAGQAVQAVAREHPFHPIRDYLNELVWDGVARIDNWLTTYFGTESSDYSRAVGSKFLIGAVARTFQSGCKVDSSPIFEGPQK